MNRRENRSQTSPNQDSLDIFRHITDRHSKMFDDFNSNFFGEIDQMFPGFGSQMQMGRGFNRDIATFPNMLEDFSSFRNFGNDDS